MDTGLENDLDMLPIDENIAYVDKKGEFQEKIKKQQKKLLRPIAQVLKKFLEPNEKILFVATGCSPMTNLETFTTGWMIYYFKACSLVFTNKRIIHLPMKSNKPKNSIAQIKYGDIQKFKVKGILSTYLYLTYKSGKKELFQQVKMKKAKLKELMEHGLQSTDATPILERQSLCPKCKKPLEKKVFTCAGCGVVFKDHKKGLLYSLVFPGGGYFYVGNRIMGVIDALAEFEFAVTIIAGIIVIFTGGKDKDLNNFVLGLSVFMLCVIKLYAVYHTKHYINEYIPVNNKDLDIEN